MANDTDQEAGVAKTTMLGLPTVIFYVPNLIGTRPSLKVSFEHPEVPIVNRHHPTRPSGPLNRDRAPLLVLSAQPTAFGLPV